MDRRRPSGKYHGLKNQGATCYLNSVLQVLFMTKNFKKAVRGHSSAPDCIDRHLSSLFNALEAGTAKTSKITHVLGIDRVHEQHDAAANLEKILSHTSREASRIFQGELTHKNKCSKCGDETNTDEPFWSLPLALLDSVGGDYRVMDGIQEFFKDSGISGDNQMYCDQCNAKEDATIQCEMMRHPEVLTLLLKRFKFDYKYKKYMKINCSVEIPYTLQIPKDHTYELYAFVEHFGELRGGHYTATIKSQDDEQWYNFNDTIVTQLGHQPFQVHDTKRSQSAYLLFYRKMPAGYNSKMSTPGASELDTRNTKKQRAERPEREREEGEEAADVNLYHVDRQDADERRVVYVRGDKDGKTGAEKQVEKGGEQGVGHGYNESVSKIRQKRSADDQELKREISDESMRYQNSKHRKLSSENHHNSNVRYQDQERLDSGRLKQYGVPPDHTGRQRAEKMMPDVQPRPGADEWEYARGSRRQYMSWDMQKHKEVVSNRGDNRGSGGNQQNKQSHHQEGRKGRNNTFPRYSEDQKRQERDGSRDYHHVHRGMSERHPGERMKDQDNWQLHDLRQNRQEVRRKDASVERHSIQEEKKGEIRHSEYRKEPFVNQHSSGSKGLTENQRVSTHKQINPHEQYKIPGDNKHDARSYSVHPGNKVQQTYSDSQSSIKTRMTQGECHPDTLLEGFQSLSLKDCPSSEPQEHRKQNITGTEGNSDEKKSSTQSNVEKTANEFDTQTKADGEKRDQSGKKGRQRRKGRNKQKQGVLALGLCVPCKSSVIQTSESE